MRDDTEICARLRELDEAITTQRNFIAHLKSGRIDCAAERRKLGALLAELDKTLREARQVA
jgi:hypothetical protein